MSTEQMTPEECARSARAALANEDPTNALAWATLGGLLLDIELHQPGTCMTPIGDGSYCGERKGHAGGHVGNGPSRWAGPGWFEQR